MSTYDYLLGKYGITLSFEQAKDELGLHPQTIRMMCQRGDIKTSRAGKKWVLTTKAIADYIDCVEEVRSDPLRKRPKKKPVRKGEYI